MCQGLDPDAVDIEIKRRISQEFLRAFGEKDGLQFMREFAKVVGLQDVRGRELRLF